MVHLIRLGFPVRSDLLLINQSKEKKSNFENLAAQKILGLSSEQGDSKSARSEAILSTTG